MSIVGPFRVHERALEEPLCLADAAAIPMREGGEPKRLGKPSVVLESLEERQRFVQPPKVGLKALLASAPLEGIDLRRSRDPGRDVDL